MTNIRAVQFKVEVNETLIEMLEEALELAKEGKLVSGHFCGTYASGEIHTTYSSTENAILELAAASRLLHRLHLRMDEP